MKNIEQKTTDTQLSLTVNEYYANIKKIDKISSINLSKYIKYNKILMNFHSDFYS
jgi:hypothetical protein